MILNTIQFSLSSVHAMRVIGESESEPGYGCNKTSSHLTLFDTNGRHKTISHAKSPKEKPLNRYEVLLRTKWVATHLNR